MSEFSYYVVYWDDATQARRAVARERQFRTGQAARRHAVKVQGYAVGVRINANLSVDEVPLSDEVVP